VLTFLPFAKAHCDRIIDYHGTTNPSSPVVNGVNVNGIGNTCGSAEGFVFDPEVALLIHQLWHDPKIMDHSSEFYLMVSES
jgi:guanine nucleotide-binding protein subunit alpha